MFVNTCDIHSSVGAIEIILSSIYTYFDVIRVLIVMVPTIF